jgi:hypothetical protein
MQNLYAPGGGSTGAEAIEAAAVAARIKENIFATPAFYLNVI